MTMDVEELLRDCEQTVADQQVLIKELRDRIAKLEAELAAANSLIQAMTPPLTKADIKAATEEAVRIRPLIEAERAALAEKGREG